MLLCDCDNALKQNLYEIIRDDTLAEKHFRRIVFAKVVYI